MDQIWSSDTLYSTDDGTLCIKWKELVVTVPYGTSEILDLLVLFKKNDTVLCLSVVVYTVR